MVKKEDLTEFGELMRVLGYKDERSAKKWCNQNKVPVLKIGSKKYILSQYLTQYIDNQLVIFVKESSTGVENLIKNDLEEKSANQHGEAAKKFLSKIKSN